MSYSLEKTTLGNAWDDFIKTSWNGTLFSYSDYLVNIPHTPGVYYCHKNQELRAAVVLLEDEDNKITLIHGLVVHSGIIFGAPTNNQNNAQQTSEKFRISEFIANELPKIYDKINLKTDPKYQDIRSFLWVNYENDAPKYKINIRYTSYLSIYDLSDISILGENNTFQNISASRKQEIRYAQKKGVTTHEEFNINLFIEYYIKTFAHQNLELGTQFNMDLQIIKRLVLGLYEKKLGRMFISYTQEGQAGSIAFFGVDHNRAYYLFGANNPDLRNEHTGTAVLWDSFKLLCRDGISEVDLEGINSPARGWFKLSFGGSVLPYYQLSYNKHDR